MQILRPDLDLDVTFGNSYWQKKTLPKQCFAFRSGIFFCTLLRTCYRLLHNAARNCTNEELCGFESTDPAAVSVLCLLMLAGAQTSETFLWVVLGGRVRRRVGM